MRAVQKPYDNRWKHKDKFLEGVWFIWFNCPLCHKWEQSRWRDYLGLLIKLKVPMSLFLIKTLVQIIVTKLGSLAFEIPRQNWQCDLPFACLDTLSLKINSYVHAQPSRQFISLWLRAFCLEDNKTVVSNCKWGSFWQDSQRLCSMRSH